MSSSCAVIWGTVCRIGHYRTTETRNSQAGHDPSSSQWRNKQHRVRHWKTRPTNRIDIPTQETQTSRQTLEPVPLFSN